MWDWRGRGSPRETNWQRIGDTAVTWVAALAIWLVVCLVIAIAARMS